jgi:hypothetical protein
MYNAIHIITGIDHTLTPQEHLDPKHPFMILTKDIWRSFALYLSPSDMLALALTCKAGAYRVNQLKRNPTQGHYVHLASHQPVNEVDLKPLEGGLDWRMIGMALPVDGLWLFVVHHYASEICLDIYQRDSLLPLKFHHQERARFKAHLEASRNVIVGLDNNKDKPGIFFVDYAFDIYSYHFGNTAPHKLVLPPDFSVKRKNFSDFSDSTCPCAVRANGENIILYRQGHHAVNEVTIDQAGTILKSRDFPLLDTGANSLTLSPNGHSLLVFYSGFGRLCVIDTHHGAITLDKHCFHSETSPQHSITDDGRNIFYHDQIAKIDNTEKTIIFGTLGFDHSHRGNIVHSGNGRIALQETQPGKIHQLVLKQSPYPVAVMDAIDAVIQMGEDNHTTIDSPFNDGRFQPRLELIRQHIPIFDISTIAKLAQSYPKQKVHLKLSLMANYLWKANMRELASKPAKPQYPLFASRQALAKSPLIHQNIPNDPGPVSTHKTADVGIVDSQLFIKSTKAQFAATALVKQYASMKARNNKQILFSSLQNQHHLVDNDLINCAMEIKPDFRIADAFCLSRNPRVDRVMKKLIPRHFNRVLQKNKTMRHYINFDAVLIKLISWMSDGKQKNDLEAARQRMIQAVKRNPSLHYDMNQLWETPFFGEASIDSCVKDPAYRRQLIRSFHIDKDYAFELVHGPRPVSH